MLSAGLVLPWSHIVGGSIAGVIVGLVVLFAIGERQPRTLAVTAVGVMAGTWLWNAMLNIRHAAVIDGDIPFTPFPISWQDTGTGVFVFAFAAVLLLATVMRAEPGIRTLKVAGIAAAAACVVDIYFW